jgi:AraC-like DNA-binding protein
MDLLDSLLDGPRSRRAFVLRSQFDPPFSLRIEDEAPVTVVGVVQGQAQLLHDSQEITTLAAGDVAIVRAPHHYAITDSPSSPLQARIRPGQVCESADGSPVTMLSTLGIRTWGNTLDPQTVLITGTYETVGEVSRILLESLPGMIVVPKNENSAPLVALFADQARRDAPGQTVVLNRLLDLLLITSLRVWFESVGEHEQGWLAAQTDTVVAEALRLMHDEPERSWTLPQLAGTIGVSRANLAKRFTHRMGAAPMSYLTSLRMALAADLLLESGATVQRVAGRVGYSGAFAFSNAFKRHHQMSPRAYQDRHKAG